MVRRYLLLLVAVSLCAQTWVETSTSKLGESEIVREQFLLEGIPVWGEEAVRVRSARAGVERVETGRLGQRRQPAAGARVAFGSLNEGEALEKAKAKLGWPEAKTHTLDRWFKADREGTLHGVWRVILTRGIGEAKRVLIDADTGDVIETFDLIQRQSAQGLVFPSSPISSPLTQAVLPGINSARLNGPNVRVFSHWPVRFGFVPVEGLISSKRSLREPTPTETFSIR